MANAFLEVFPTLQLNHDIKGLLSEAVVTKVASNRSRDFIRVYLDNTRLIPKRDIWRLEEEMKNQLFPNQKMRIKLMEHYRLSGQYTAKTLLDTYKESMLCEIKEYSLLLYNVFRTAEITFSGDTDMTLTLEDTLIARESQDELIEILDKIVRERCGIAAKLEIQFAKKKENPYKENAKRQMDMEVENIVKRTSMAHADSGTSMNGAELIGAAEGIGAENGDRTANNGSIGSGAGNTAQNDTGWYEVPGQETASNKTEAKKEQSPVKGDSSKKGSFKKREYSIKRSDNPDVFYGRDFEDETVTIDTIQGEVGEVAVRGQIMSVDVRELRNGEKSIVKIVITDFTDSIAAKIFVKNEQRDELLEQLKSGNFIKLKGVTTMDKFDNEIGLSFLVGMKKIPDFTTPRMDHSVEKRVELHCHTKMSDMDGVSDVKDIIKRAKAWGHKAIAITDHGAVQAFTDAHHSVSPEDDFKVIYGVEAYLVDDLKDIITNSRNQSLDDSYVVFDLETTGFSPNTCKIIEIGAVKVENGKITERFSEFVNPKVPIPYKIEELTGIRDDMVMSAESIEEILPRFMEFCEGCVMVAHNAEFDMSFIRKNCKDMGIACNYTVGDTVAMAHVLLPALNRYKLDTVAKALKISLENHHRAVDDAECTAHIFVKFIEMLKERNITVLDELNKLGAASAATVKKLPTHHAIILAQNEIGRVNLYRLVSESHMTYYARRPRIPKSLYLKYKEGLCIGSACEAGELYQAILNGKPEEEIARLVNFYDYLEIQPLGNNKFMLESDKAPVETMEELQDINRKICKLGEEFHKLVVATCDVHFLDPQDEVYRRIIMAGKGFKDADDQAPLYLRTTEEMLAEFEYLGSEKAREVVITNPNKIAAMCERIEPVRPDKCPPVIENSDQMLRDICYNKAHEMYGDALPSIVQERLERELNSIISNGYAVMYIIAQKLVWKSNEDGYLVGSRGSVGSSFVATMSGITEVNPLRPHYYCKKCHYSDFDSEEVLSYAGRSGCDMPDKNCPECGEPLVKDGFDIPFETFLGFKGNKEPDIDLNFSGDYQGKAHRYTEVIFGEGQTFRAGTIGTLADKTAFGYAKNYYEERGMHKRNCEIDRIVQGCVGIRRTTGQHPGGIVVLPVGEEIYSFTPVQHPANDMTTDIITTHFDYHSIDHNLLKLDILGHDDPTMIRMLEDLTGIDAQKIPLDEPTVMSLFLNTSALGVTPEDLGGCPLGSLGIPEFGTDFVIQMLIDTKPQSFSDLIRISGLSHGTDVWLGNAQTLIENGDATISTAICTRDDIMIYLIGMGVESELSFTIMEAVRKGKGLKDEWITVMKEHDVPDWYIWSCQKIKYMFPKAHAAAYVMMAWRIAYCKVYYPLAYYAAFFSIRATAFSYELMCQGKDKLEYFMKDYEKRKDTLTKKEQDTVKDMRIVQEMYARGFEFLPLDIYTAKAEYFQIIDGKLMPALNTIEGLGDKAAEAVEDAAKQGIFLSKDDFRQRTKVSKTVIDMMGDLGLLEGLPESNQLSLFDL